MAKLIEELWSASECTLNTFFRVGDLDGVEDDCPFEIELIDKMPEDGEGDESSLAGNKLNFLRVFLMNTRTIAAILTHVLFSQVKMLVKTRVIYDRELFNYEEYTSKCLSDNRLLTKIILASTTSLPNKMPPGKYLMGEFFKF